MRTAKLTQGLLVAVWALLALGLSATPARAAAGDPLAVFSAPAAVPPGTGFNGPCGLAVDGEGRLYVSDYYHRAVDVFGSSFTYITQLANAALLGGPCQPGGRFHGPPLCQRLPQWCRAFYASRLPTGCRHQIWQ